MSKGRKIAVSLTKAFAGCYGVDCFIMGNTSMGVKRIIITVVLYVLSFFSVIPWIGWVIGIIVGIISFVRWLRFLISGLTMLNKDETLIKAYYY